MPGTPLAVRSQRRTSSPRAIPSFGEQIGEATSGFGYNGEYYNAVTGMVYLRARFYETEMNRFSQKDILHGNILNTGSLNRYSYVQNDPINYYDPSGEFGLLVGTAIAAGISALIAGGVSAYQSYKSTGSVNWKAAGQAALGGTVSAVDVVLAVATGGTALGVATMAVEAYAGGRTVMCGGDAAAVTTAMAKTGAGAYVAEVVAPYIPPVGNLIIGSAGAVASGYRTVVDTGSAVFVFGNPYASPMDKLNAVADVAEDVVGFFGSVKMAVDSIRILFSSNDYNALCSRHKTSDNADISDPPTVEIDDTVDAVQKPDTPAKVTTSVDEVSEAIREAQSRVSSGSFDDFPQNAKDAYNKYDKAGWKGNVSGQTPGTGDGGNFANDGRQGSAILPSSTSDGTPISYREFDVNNKIAGQARGSKRFLIGDDGSLYYTPDRYKHMIRVK